jgi:type II secretory pathway pseudopilin PulG
MESDRGFALAASLAVLALLSVLGAAAIQSTTLEVQISARDRDARSALYIAESALEEARYYAARGWGKITFSGVWVAGSIADVTVATPLPPASILPWSANLYTGFRLYDSTGADFPVVGNTDTLPYRITIDSSPNGEPSPGRFVLVREIPSPSVTPPETTSVSSNVLTVAGWAPASALASGTDTWRGWTLWDSNGQPLQVEASTSDAVSGVVTLAVPAGQTPGPGPYTLSINPWLAALTGNSAPAGDADPSTPAAWDRTFTDNATPSNTLGSAGVTAQWVNPGEYRMTSVGRTGMSSRKVSLLVHRGGRPDQRVGDWKVGGEN